MNVLIPDALLSYTQKRRAQASGATLGQLLDDLERQYAGIRFRMIDEQDRVRRHIRIFVNGEQVNSKILEDGDHIRIGTVGVVFKLGEISKDD